VGTSFSTPMVAGTAALMLSVDPSLSPATLRNLLQSTARPFPTSGSGPGIAQCKPPTATAQDECYCNTSTCGAGMLDAAAAVAAVVPASVAPPTASIVASRADPPTGTNLTLSSRGSGVYAGRSIAAYEWRITAGATLASWVGATTGRTATLATSAPGSVTVSLTVTDSGGATGTSTSVVNVQSATAGPTSGGGATGSSGGGATSVAWLALLTLAIAALAWPERGHPGGLSRLKGATRKA
jgi:serine protease